MSRSGARRFRYVAAVEEILCTECFVETIQLQAGNRPWICPTCRKLDAVNPRNWRAIENRQKIVVVWRSDDNCEHRTYLDLNEYLVSSLFTKRQHKEHDDEETHVHLPHV